MEVLRRELEHRPLLLAAIALCIGLSVVSHPLNLLGLVLLFVGRRPVPVTLGFVLGLAFAPHAVANLKSPEWIRGTATVLNVPYASREGISADLLVSGRKFRAVFPFTSIVSRGEVWRLQGKATPLGETAEGLLLQGVSGRLKPVSLEKVADGPWPFRLADQWRRSFERFAHANLSPTNARWLGAFAFRIYDLDDEEMDALKATGTIHLIAASGIHVAALGLLGMGLGQLFGVPRSVTLSLVLTGLLFYAMATGLHLPTVRAVLAFGIGTSAYLFGRQPDGLSALSLAVLTYLPFDPAQIYGLGFQLSVTVVGLLILWPHRYDLQRSPTAQSFFLHHGRDLISVSIVAALAAEPILALHEGKITLLTVPANVVSVPLVMVSVLLSFALHPMQAGWAMPVVEGLVNLGREVVLWADGLPNATLVVGPFWAYWLVPYYGLWIVFWRPRARPCD